MADVTINGYGINLLPGYQAEFASKYSPSSPKPAACTVPLLPYVAINPVELDLTIPDCHTGFDAIPFPDPHVSIPCIPSFTSNVTINGPTTSSSSSGTTNYLTIIPKDYDLDGHPCAYELKGVLDFSQYIPPTPPDPPCPTQCGTMTYTSLGGSYYDARGIGLYQCEDSCYYEINLELGCVGAGAWTKMKVCTETGVEEHWLWSGGVASGNQPPGAQTGSIPESGCKTIFMPSC